MSSKSTVTLPRHSEFRPVINGNLSDYTRWIVFSESIVLVCLLTYSVGRAQWVSALAASAAPVVSSFFTPELLLFMLVGWVAQIIDGALGMAYGISSTSFLLGIGVPPAAASAGVHVAEIFTTGISGLSHLKLGNVNRKLFQRLVLPGVIGVVLGAYVLTSIDGDIIKPVIAVYLFVMGIVVIRKAFRRPAEPGEPKNLSVLAVFGGFMDAVGGGGWGPIVASTLLSKGHNPRYAIGSVNLAEFFVAIAGAGAFLSVVGIDNWRVIVGLIIGGMFAAPFAAYLCKKFAPRTLMIMVGVLVMALSIRTLFLIFV